MELYFFEETSKENVGILSDSVQLLLKAEQRRGMREITELS